MMRRMRRALSAILVMAMIMTAMVVPVSAATTFTDVKSDKWYAGSVERWTDADILNGYGDGTFKPAKNITRAEVAKIVSELLGLEAVETITTLSDVDGHWAQDYIKRCWDAGIVTGYPDGTFLPNDPVTREEAFTMVIRAIPLVAENAETVIGEFTDGSKVQNYAKEATAALIASGAVNGYPDGSLKPQNNITRAEFVKTLDYLISMYVDGEGEVSVSDNRDDFFGSAVVVNFKNTEDVEVTYENGNVTIGENKVTLSEADVTPVAVHGLGSTSVEADTTLFVDGGHDDIDDCTNCAVDRTPVSVCDICGETEHATVDAHPHTFEDGVCTCCGMKEEDAWKFKAKVTSNDNYVEAVVTNDYVAKLTVTPGKVDASNVAVEVYMKDVASLGVDDVRSESKEFNTGLSGDPELKVWLSNVFAFEGGNVKATVQGKQTDYTLAGEVDENGNAVITGTPVDVQATREAWAELTDHVSSTTQETSDSYIEIANGSYMIVDDDKLSFEKGDEVGNLKLDGFSSDMSSLDEQIRSKVQLNTSEAFKSEYQAQFYLAAGTKLAVSNSIATLDDNCLITVKGDGLNTEDFGNVLEELQAAEGGYAMAEKLVKMLNAMVGSANGGTIEVAITFTEPAAEKDTKFYFGVTANNADGNGTTTVDMEVYDDYSLEINLPLNEISASQVTLDVAMNDVASLGTAGTSKSHTQTVNTGMTATGDLAFWMSNAKDFTSATINATIDGNACTYNLTSDMDADWVTITGTTDTAAARTAWQALTSHITTSDNDGDSKIIVSEKSSVNIGAEALVFEDGADAMVLDNFSDLSALKTEIKDSVKVVEGDGSLTLVVGAGTVLAVDGSKATLDDTATITITGLDLSDTTLSQIREESNDNNALVKCLFTVLNDAVGAANGATINVDITFAAAE